MYIFGLKTMKKRLKESDRKRQKRKPWAKGAYNREYKKVSRALQKDNVF